MKRIAIAVRLKRRVFNTKFRLWKHKAEYYYHVNTERVLFGAAMFGCFVMQVVLYFVGR